MGPSLPKARLAGAALAWALCVPALAARGADHVDITWMSIANLHLDFGTTRVLVDGYITRLPESLFFGGNGRLAHTRSASRPDEAAVRDVFEALGGRSAIDLLITGHSHFDHSFDTPVWARLSGGRLVGSATTCLQARAAGIPARRCRTVAGGERIPLRDGVTMYVVRWNHSGDPVSDPELHAPRELASPPVPDRQGRLHAGVVEDFPNGGGSRAYLFVLTTPGRPISLFFQDSAGAVDLDRPLVVDGHDFGAPLENLRRTLEQAGLDRVDLWVGTGGAEVASLVLPILRPRAYLPVHWDGLFDPFKAGPPAAFADARLASLLAANDVALITPAQYMDKWRLDASGVHGLENGAVKARLGFR